jgi:phenylacetate-CoA ligase
MSVPCAPFVEAPMFERLKHVPLANALLRRPPALYHSARKCLKRTAAMDRPALEAWQNDRINQVMSAARRLRGFSGITTSKFDEWPILNKSQILGRESLFLAKGLLPLVPASTGGTTGQPMKLKRTWRGIAFEQAMIDHICAERGIEAEHARIAVLRGDTFKPASDMSPPFWTDEGSSRRIFSAHHLGPANITHYAQALREFKPDILFCYPSSLAAFAGLLGDEPEIRMPLIFCSSEMLPRDTLERARRLFGADVIDFYGHAERIACAWAVNGEGYRFVPAYGRVELLPAGDGLARIVASSLSHKGQLFLRYDTGDLARVPSHDPAILEEIALGLRPFDGIEGRESEYIELADGRRIIGLNHIPRGVTGAATVQLHKSGASEVTIYVSPITGAKSYDEKRLIENFRQKFPETIEMKIVLVERPVRERNGKAPLLLRLPKVESIVRLSGQKCPILEQVT